MKVAVESKSKHHLNPLMSLRRMIYALFGKGQSRGWPRGQGQVTPPKVTDWVRGSCCIWINLGAQRQHNGAFLDSLSLFDRKFLTQNADDLKRPLWRHLWHQTRSKMQKKNYGDMPAVHDNNISCVWVPNISFKLRNEQCQRIPPKLMYIHIMGGVTWLTWPQMIYMKNTRYKQCEYPGACFFLKVSSSWEILPAIGSVAKLRHFVTMRKFA